MTTMTNCQRGERAEGLNTQSTDTGVDEAEYRDRRTEQEETSQRTHTHTQGWAVTGISFMV